MRPSVLAAKGEPFSLGSMLLPMRSNSRSLLELSDPKAHNLKNFQKTSSSKPSNVTDFTVCTTSATFGHLVVTNIILPSWALFRGAQNLFQQSPFSFKASSHMSS